jgi:hypothetical protein
MKRLIIYLSVAAMILGLGGTAMAAPVTFNFNSLADGANALAISTYMSTLFGGVGSVNVTGASPQAESAFFGLLGPDTYIESEPWGGHTIQINFATAITSVSFDWGQFLDSFHADYLIGSTWTLDFFSQGYAALGTGNSGTINLPAGVVGLRFHDENLGEVGIDNLIVEKAAVPEPMSLLLLGLGLLGIGAVRRKN